MTDLLLEVLDHVEELVVFYESDFRVVWLNQAVERWSGKPRSQIIKKRCFDVFYGRSAPCIGCLVEKVIKRGQPVQSEHQGMDGRIWSVRAYPVKSSDGSLRGVLEISLDLSPLKAAQAALKEREKHYGAVLQSIADGVCVIRGNSWEIEHVNPAFTEMLAYESHPRAGTNLLDFAEDRDFLHRQLSETLRLGKARVVETRLQTPEGAVLDVELSLNPLSGQETCWMVVVCRDLRSRNMTLAENLRNQKLQSLAVMAQGLAHDFNNILAGVVGNLSLAKLDADPESRLYSRLIAAEKACVRAEQVTQRLLTFADGGDLKPSSIGAGQFISQSLLPALSSLNVELSWNVSMDLPKISVDAHLLANALADLVADVFVHKGARRIHVEGQVHERDEGNHAVTLGSGPMVRILLSAPNVRLSATEVDRLFEPYALNNFAVGQGLGGCAAYAVVRQHAGHLRAESHDATGTRLIVWLPAEDAVFKEEANLPKDVTSFYQRRLLIMDDEKIVRETLGEILKIKGFEVTLAADGQEAVALYQIHQAKGRPFDVVILDLTVRGGPGAVEVLKDLRRLDPNVKAFVASGYTLDPVMIDYVKYGFCGVALKPFQYDELAERLHNMMTVGEG